MEILSFTNKAPLTEKDAKQMAQAIEAFEKGEQQPEGRFVIIKELKSDNE
jgi:hypothetical protein